MKTKFKNAKGITLIALVITIIVLLILAGIAISMLSGENGILRKAADSKVRTDEESTLEQIKLGATAAMMHEKHKILDAESLKKALENQGLKNPEVTGDATNGYEVLVNGVSYSISGSGKISIDQKWRYKKDKDGRETIVTNGEIDLPIGTYISYNAGDTTASTTETTYTSKKGTYASMGNTSATATPVRGSGYSEEQKFDAKLYSGKWKVLGLDRTTGEILIVSADGIKTNTNNNYYLRGYTGVQYGEIELDNICKIFGYGKGASTTTVARSMDVEDINRLTGYNPNNIGVYDPEQTGNGTRYDYDSTNRKITEYSNKVTYSWTATSKEISYKGTNNAIGTYTGSAYNRNGFSWFDKEAGKWKISNQSDYDTFPAEITTITSTYYYYYPYSLTTSNTTTGDTKGLNTKDSTSPSYKVYATLFLNDSGNQFDYWLASSCVETSKDDPIYRMRRINNGYVNSHSMYYSEGWISDYNNTVRPVVSLNSKVKLKHNKSNSCYDIVE